MVCCNKLILEDFWVSCNVFLKSGLLVPTSKENIHVDFDLFPSFEIDFSYDFRSDSEDTVIPTVTAGQYPISFVSNHYQNTTIFFTYDINTDTYSVSLDLNQNLFNHERTLSYDKVVVCEYDELNSVLRNSFDFYTITNYTFDDTINQDDLKKWLRNIKECINA